MPRRQNPDHKVILNKSPDPAPFPAFLPLAIFDNTDYDSRTAEEWLSLGCENSTGRKPVPGKALLITDDKQKCLDPKDPSLVYKWINVGVLDYNPETQLWLVQKVDDQGRILNEKGHPFMISSGRKSGIVEYRIFLSI